MEVHGPVLNVSRRPHIVVLPFVVTHDEYSNPRRSIRSEFELTGGRLIRPKLRVPPWPDKEMLIIPCKLCLPTLPDLLPDNRSNLSVSFLG